MSIIYANLAHFVTVSLPTRRTASAATIIGHSNMCDKDKSVLLMYCTTVSLSLALFLSRSFSLSLSLCDLISGTGMKAITIFELSIQSSCIITVYTISRTFLLRAFVLFRFFGVIMSYELPEH